MAHAQTIRITALLGLCLLLTACSGSGSSSSSNSLMPSVGGVNAPSAIALLPTANPPIADLPVPIGFKLVTSISREYKTDDHRFVDHTYNGREHPESVEAFYETQMPNHGWTLTAKRMARGAYELEFTKGNQDADVRITTEKTLTAEYTAIAVAIQTTR